MVRLELMTAVMQLSSDGPNALREQELAWSGMMRQAGNGSLRAARLEGCIVALVAAVDASGHYLLDETKLDPS